MLTFSELSQGITDLTEAHLSGDIERVYTLYDQITSPGGTTYDHLMRTLARRNLEPDLISEIGALLTRRFIVEATP